MSIETTIEIILNIIQMIILIPIIIISAETISKDKTGIVGALFTFSMISVLLTDIYWIAYDMLRPDTHMPFSGEEIAGSAVILLLASALSPLLPKGRKLSVRGIVLTLLFMAANIILWIAWSGEWAQDIIFGLPYVYLMLVLMKGIEHFEIFGKRECIFAVAICSVIIILHFSVLATEGELRSGLDLINYLIMIATVMLFFIKNLRMMKDKRPGRAVCASFCLFFYSVIVLYMSSGYFYDIATFFYTLTLPLMLINVKKEITRSDLC